MEQTHQRKPKSKAKTKAKLLEENQSLKDCLIKGAKRIVGLKSIEDVDAFDVLDATENDLRETLGPDFPEQEIEEEENNKDASSEEYDFAF